ncbi:Na+/H+ antiporter subunit A [Actinomycetaceae bacterium MB13-C1-2]|nr:Na+/H+ antiporter subunit A [Actinomycetaceae bacterium MB13-C1-2]
MLLLLALHFTAAICAPAIIGRFGRNAFYGLALVPATAFIYAVANTQRIMASPIQESYRWVPSLDLEIAFVIDVTTWLMMMIVGGVGTLVMIYTARYFSAGASGLGRFGGIFLAFSGSMLGVVTADQTMTLYVFWELTSVMSYLLIGFHHGRRPARSAARQAILTTGGAALAMFAGLVIMGEAPGGSYRISQLLENLRSGAMDATSPLVITAAVLIMIGALAKSAQVPFHFWLPGAMAAPTPVSAYLHAASMVKAGVYLIARLTPGFYMIPGWSQIAVTFGLMTMVIGAYRALKQRDLKLILAYGTVSQLGLMTAAVGFGTASTLAAGKVILVAHALFKSSLFLTVGAVESSTGTRDIWELSGLWKKNPLLAVFAGLSCLSMAGVPITTGYLGKEAVISALYSGTDANWLPASNVAEHANTLLPTPNGAIGWILLIIVSLASMLTVAYSWRFWWGAFGTKQITVEMEAEKVPGSMLAPIGILAAGALLGGAASGFQAIGDRMTEGMPGHSHIALWSGPGPAVVTAIILGGGILLAAFRPQVSRIQRSVTLPISAVKVYSWILRELEVLASFVTVSTQRGSLPAELSTIFSAVIVVGAYALFRAPVPSVMPQYWDSLLQLGIVIVGVVAVIATISSKNRIRAALALGAVGMSVSLLFAQYGAPDLALTQLAVEAVSIVVFILVLRKLPAQFSYRPLMSSRITRLIISVGVGLVASVGGYYAISSRIHDPVSKDMPAEALNFGYGKNIVNVILVDMRAWDTVGELSVLLVTATGVASLIYIVTRTSRAATASREQSRSNEGPNGSFLVAGRMQDKARRSVVLEVSTRLLFPTMIMLSIWLLFVGHNNPGGGFAGGVIAGLAFVLRYLAGGRHELAEAMPIPAGYLLGAGLFISAAGGALPLFYGRSVLQSVPIDISLGALGDLHFTTAMILDIGVYVLVLGLVIDLVSALGAEIDYQSERASQGRRPAPAAPLRKMSNHEEAVKK